MSVRPFSVSPPRGSFLRSRKKVLPSRRKVLSRLVRMKLQLSRVHQAQVLGILQQARKRFGTRVAELHAIQEQSHLSSSAFGLSTFDPSSGRSFFINCSASARSARKAAPDSAPGFPRSAETIVMRVHVHHRRTTDDQWHARFVDEDRVHFIYDRVIMAALDLLVAARSHALSRR